MRAAIFNHPFYDFYTSPNRLSPGILEYLAQLIQPHESICFDVVKKMSSEAALPKHFSNLKPYIINDTTEFSFFNSYKRYGAVNNFNHKQFNLFSPAVILITSFAYCYAQGLNEMIVYLRTISDAAIVIGGGGPSADPEYYKTHSNADYVISGMAEDSLKDFLDSLSGSQHVKPKTDKPVIYPYYSINKKLKKLQLQLTRGCPKKCSYCSVHLTADNQFFTAELSDIEKLFKRISKKNRIYEIDFEDDNLTINKEYFLKILALKEKYFPDVLISFENGIDFTTIDTQLLQILIKNKIKQFNISFTSSSDELLKLNGRSYTFEIFDKEIDRLIATKVPVIAYFIAGLPEDTIDSIYETMIYLAGKPLLPGISPFYAVPGTVSFTEIEESYKVHPYQSMATAFNGYGFLSSEQKISFFMLSRFINALKRYTHISDKNTRLGVKQSLVKRTITAVTASGGLQAYPLCKEINDRFFDELFNGLLITDQQGQRLDIKEIIADE